MGNENHKKERQGKDEAGMESRSVRSEAEKPTFRGRMPTRRGVARYVSLGEVIKMSVIGGLEGPGSRAMDGVCSARHAMHACIE